MAFPSRPLRRDHWQRQIEQLDPETQYEEISRLAAHYEFPWDIQQALSFALFRTFAVPSIGRLLHETGAFETDTQRRHDDTVLILDAILVDGLETEGGRAAIRRMNQMHGAYEISNDDMRYVLATFVVTPVRWIERYGWRGDSGNEKLAAVNYYRRLGRLMGIQDIPKTYDEFAELLDSYERDYFGFDAGGRQVADATLNLFISFYPRIVGGLVRQFAISIMDSHVREAFGYPHPHKLMQTASHLALRARAKIVRFFPPRRHPKLPRNIGQIKSYPNGYEIEKLGTFPSGCPVTNRNAG